MKYEDGQLNPARICVHIKKRKPFNETRGPGAWEVKTVDITDPKHENEFFILPGWVVKTNSWKVELGQILRYALTGSFDYARSISQPKGDHKNIPRYKAPRSHWLEAKYGYYHGQDVFGGNWVPLSDWAMGMLYELLRWPGCTKSRFSGKWKKPQDLVGALDDHIKEVEGMRGKHSGLIILSQDAPRSKKVKNNLRVALVQSAYPRQDDFINKNLDFESKEYQTKSGQHLTAILGAVEQLLRVRRTHQTKANEVDWLIFPELAIHHNQVWKYLVPFVRRHKCLVLAGLTYHHFPGSGKRINSAYWLIPTWDKSTGFHIKILEQGKEHLAHNEQSFKRKGLKDLIGFRPCQWIVKYQTDPSSHLSMTASICYDATDLSLAADLRNQSDIFAVQAFTKPFTRYQT